MLCDYEYIVYYIFIFSCCFGGIGGRGGVNKFVIELFNQLNCYLYYILKEIVGNFRVS